MPERTRLRIGRERGLAMLALVTLLALVSSYFIASALTRTTTDVQNVRESSNLQTLNAAKAALISWVAQDTFTKAYNGSSGSFQPGSLPCPDTNDDGYAEGTCSSAASRIGRFPWRTVNAPDLRDSSGERLWYALSDSFRAASGTTVINPDTSGALSVTGAFSSSTVPAIIFAPGPAFSTQSRDVAGWNTASNYLEGWTAATSNYSYLAASAKSRLTISGNSTLVTPNEEDCSDTTRETYCLRYNDTLVLVSNEDIFKVAESTVPTMLQQLVTTGALNLTGYFEYYRSKWGRYPFPAQFTNPSSSTFKGTVGQANGLLPVTTDSTFVTWRTSPTPTWTDTNLTTGDISTQDCTASTSTLISCDLTWSSRPTIQIDLNLNGAGQAFIDGLSISNISLTYISNGFTLTPTMSVGYPTHTLSPYQSGNSWGTIRVRMRLPTRTTTYGTVRLRISLPSFLAITSTSDATTGWMLSNRWHWYLQYAVAAGYLPDSASGSCSAGTNCLTASGLPSSFASTNDKRVILVFAGRALAADTGFTGQTHHSSLLADYFEGANAIADTMFTHQQAASRSFNDKIVVVAP